MRKSQIDWAIHRTILSRRKTRVMENKKKANRVLMKNQDEDEEQTQYRHKWRVNTPLKNDIIVFWTARSQNKNLHDARYPAPISQKRLADTYMVGGCTVDLSGKHDRLGPVVSSTKKAAMFINSIQSSTRQQGPSLISHSNSLQKYSGAAAHTLRHRHSNHNSSKGPWKQQ